MSRASGEWQAARGKNFLPLATNHSPLAYEQVERSES